MNTTIDMTAVIAKSAELNNDLVKVLPSNFSKVKCFPVSLVLTTNKIFGYI